MCFVGMCPPITADVFLMGESRAASSSVAVCSLPLRGSETWRSRLLGFTMHNITTSNTGGRKEMMEMLQYCARHKIGATVVERPMSGESHQPPASRPLIHKTLYVPVIARSRSQLDPLCALCRGERGDCRFAWQARAIPICPDEQVSWTSTEPLARAKLLHSD